MQSDIQHDHKKLNDNCQFPTYHVFLKLKVWLYLVMDVRYVDVCICVRKT